MEELEIDYNYNLTKFVDLLVVVNRTFHSYDLLVASNVVVVVADDDHNLKNTWMLKVYCLYSLRLNDDMEFVNMLTVRMYNNDDLIHTMVDDSNVNVVESNNIRSEFYH